VLTFRPRTLRRAAGPLGLLGLATILLLGLAGCGDPPTTDAGGSAPERPEECAEPSSMQVSIGGAPIEFVASSSVANHVDEQTWVVAVGDVDVEVGSATSLGDLPPGPAQGTRVAIRLHSADGPIESGQTLTAADLGVGVSVSQDGAEIPVTSLGAQATVAYVDDSNICGSISVTDETATGNAGATTPSVTVGGTFVASLG
jgi:hypothetical protein